MAFQDSLKVSRQRLEFIYSIAVMVIIPILIIAMTVLLIIPTREGFDRVRGVNADLVNGLLSASFTRLDEDTEQLQSFIDQVSSEQEEISNFFAAIKTESGDFQIIAAQDKVGVGELINATQFSLVETANRPITIDVENENGANFSRVVSPIREGETVIGVSSVDVSQAISEDTVSQILSRSLFTMMAVVTVTVLMLLNHFRFVEYAVLFRKLKEVDQLKNDFLSVATHELKAPMSVIKGSLENVLDGVAGHIDDVAKENLQLAFNETDRLTTLVADLLNVSRIEQGRVSYNKEAVDPSEVIMRIVRQYMPKAREKGLELSYEQSEMDNIITVDRGRFLEIMTNLIDNAIKYSRKGTVTISHKVENDMLKTTVRDTGVGMSAKERENLFQRFYRVRNEQTKDIGGTGLGLWIIKQYIEAQDGHIYVDSLENVGSEFTVEFPLTAQKKASPPEVSVNT